MTKKTVNLEKINSLLAPKNKPVSPAIDASQRGSEEKDEKTKESYDDIVNLSFKVPGSFRKRFKLAAVNAGITQNELVQQALAFWEAQHIL